MVSAETLELFEKHGYEMKGGEKIGRDPREMETSDLNAIGHEKMPILKAIREKCMDCSFSQSEVRKCTSFGCALWPYRMGSNPFSERTGNPDALLAARAAREQAKELDEAA